jgi:hypothetical protein
MSEPIKGVPEGMRIESISYDAAWGYIRATLVPDNWYGKPLEEIECINPYYEKTGEFREPKPDEPFLDKEGHVCTCGFALPPQADYRRLIVRRKQPTVKRRFLVEVLDEPERQLGDGDDRASAPSILRYLRYASCRVTEQSIESDNTL